MAQKKQKEQEEQNRTDWNEVADVAYKEYQEAEEEGQTQQKPLTEQERLEQRVARLKNEIAQAETQLKERKRKDETRRKVLTGAVVLKAMGEDKKLRDIVAKLLESELTKPHDRALFADFGLVAGEVKVKESGVTSSGVVGS